MLVFIDDSGDPGFKLDKGSSAFFVIALVIFDDEMQAEKVAIAIKELRSSKNSFYGYAIKSVLKHSGGTIQNAKIKIDGSGDRIFRKSFLSYLRRQLNSEEKQIMKSCKLVDSRGNVLVQLADMIAGSIHRSHNTTKNDAKSYKSIIKQRIENEWFFQ